MATACATCQSSKKHVRLCSAKLDFKSYVGHLVTEAKEIELVSFANPCVGVPACYLGLNASAK